MQEGLRFPDYQELKGRFKGIPTELRLIEAEEGLANLGGRIVFYPSEMVELVVFPLVKKGRASVGIEELADSVRCYVRAFLRQQRTTDVEIVPWIEELMDYTDIAIDGLYGRTIGAVS